MCWIDEPSQPTSCSQSGRIDCFRLLGFLLVLLAAGPAPAGDCGGGFRCQTGLLEGVTGVKGAAEAHLLAIIGGSVAPNVQIVAVKTDLVALRRHLRRPFGTPRSSAILSPSHYCDSAGGCVQFKRSAQLASEGADARKLG